MRDILEGRDTIREHLLAWAMSKGGMRKRMVGDIPDWYKNLLLEAVRPWLVSSSGWARR